MTAAAGADDACLDAVAMLRASLEGRHGDVDAVLDAAADRGTGPVDAIARVLLGIAADLAVRVAAAAAVIGDGPGLEFVTGERSHELAASGSMRAAVSGLLAAQQSALTGKGTT